MQWKYSKNAAGTNSALVKSNDSGTLKKLHVEFSSDYDSSPNQRCLGQRSVLTQRCPGQQGINKPKRKLLRDFAKVEKLYVQWVKMTVSRAKFFFYLPTVTICLFFSWHCPFKEKFNFFSNSQKLKKILWVIQIISLMELNYSTRLDQRISSHCSFNSLLIKCISYHTQAVV